MSTPQEMIDDLDLSVFDHVDSQSTRADRSSLLLCQRAVARYFGTYSYLEIGSHLGGSIQPHIVDNRCTHIHSIDPRPLQQPDDRRPGSIYNYPDNSTERMLNQLAKIPNANIDRIDCIELASSQIDSENIVPRPHMLFIDGEHTADSVLKDFAFCLSVCAADALILFHDFEIIYPAIRKICRNLETSHPDHVAAKLRGSVFCVFLSGELMESDEELCQLIRRNRPLTGRYMLLAGIKRRTPEPCLRLTERVFRFLRGTFFLTI